MLSDVTGFQTQFHHLLDGPGWTINVRLSFLIHKVGVRRAFILPGVLWRFNVVVLNHHYSSSLASKAPNKLPLIEWMLHIRNFMYNVWMLSGSVMSDCLWPHGLYPARLLCPWNFPGKNIGVCCHFLLQGIFLTQRSNPRLFHLLH